MPPRPTIELDGLQYERRAGTWYRANLRVSDLLAGQLDQSAKRHPGIWRECELQDGEDTATGLREKSRTVVRRTASPAGVTSPIYWQFEDTKLVLMADLARGWMRRSKTLASVCHARIAAPEALVLRAQITLMARGCTGSMDEAPSLEPTCGDESGVTIFVTGSNCLVTLNLLDGHGGFSQQLKWSQTRTGRPMLHRRKDGLRREIRHASSGEAMSSFGQFEIQVLLVVQPPARKPSPTYYEWTRRFFPGGLPSLGKRS